MLYHGGQKADKGTYWNMETGDRIEMAHEGMLPGEGRARYIRAKSTVVLLFGPLLGLVYAMFLPFIGIAMTLFLVFRRLGSAVTDLAAQSMSFGWRPGESYLGGKQKKKKKTDTGAKKDEAGT